MRPGKWPRRIRLLAWFVCGLLGGALPAAAMPRTQAIPGGILVLTLPAEFRPGDALTFLGRPVLTVPANGVHQALVGIPLSAAAGAQQLSWRPGGGPARPIGFHIQAHHYPEQRLTIADTNKVNPDARSLRRIEREQKEILASFRTHTAAVPVLDFVLPAQGPLSSNFGLRRVINGQARSPHSGIDIAAPAGAPVRAPAPGVVLRVGDYFFTGNTVFVDHGGGLISLYCHLSAVAVAPGRQLATGELIGNVGATGRATGPHLHWAVSLNDARVDPRLLLTTPPTAQAP